MEERRRLRKAGCKGKVIAEASKNIQRAIKKSTRKKQNDKIAKILDNFSGLKQIASIRAGGKKRQMSAMTRKDGVEVQEKKEMADVFADFYEELYESRWSGERDGRGAQGEEGDEGGEEAMPKVTVEEVQEQFKRMAKKKAADGAGIVAEMVQKGGVQLAAALAELFTVVMSGQERPPDHWKRAEMRVLYKAGDAKDPANYIQYACFQFCTNCSAKFCATECKKNWTEPRQPTRQDSGATSLVTTTFSR